MADLVDELIGRFPPEARRVLVDPDGGLERSIQIMVNEEGFLTRDELLVHDGSPTATGYASCCWSAGDS